MPRKSEIIRMTIAGVAAAIALPAVPLAPLHESLGASLQAQGSIAPSAEWRATPVFAMWHFGTAVTQPAGDLTDVRQVAVPLNTRFQLQRRWTVDVGGAVSSSTVSLTTSGTKRTLSLSGLSDLNVRLTGPLKGDALLLTAGVNIPTGSTELDGDATTVLQTVAAPALAMPVGALGLGFGGTVGVLGAREFGNWALALGASLEQRTEYTPVALALCAWRTRSAR